MQQPLKAQAPNLLLWCLATLISGYFYGLGASAIVVVTAFIGLLMARFAKGSKPTIESDQDSAHDVF